MDIANIKNSAEKEIFQVVALGELEQLRIKYLGKKSELAGMLSGLGRLSKQERPLVGKSANECKVFIQRLLEEKEKTLKNKPVLSDIDITLPAAKNELGREHILSVVLQDICDVFIKMGFSVLRGPEIETEFNNFTGLNIPLDHPSRESFDTFYVKTAKNQERLLLRSHTSPMQIRAMKENKPPLAVVVPGKVYRPDAVDASHSFMFHQVEGFLVDKNIKFSDLKGVLREFALSFFGKDIKMRFRPHFFPFTEPSAEADISCIICNGKGCSVCGKKGWLEILGAGMIHPNVFKHVGYKRKVYSGFAFGMGVERIAMLKYGITDIRLFFENDKRFLEQF
ncbi:MAG: phenylalanine--tRNA ligase subunit alpha [Candidatus Gygaella obscura]|nr:phenylalanine--tRNA ligase subunit alpha [Candidatus Gygaella obscura]